MAAFIDTVNLLVSPLPLHKRDIERIVGRVRHNFEISRKRRKKGRKERKPEIFRNFRKSRTLDDIPRRVVKSERAENPDLFPVVASLSSSRNFLHPPPWPLLSSSRSALLTLYTSICYAVALCATDRRDPAQGVLADLSLTLSSPPRLYLASIIKINRPISYVKYYPRARLNILSLSTLPLPLLLPPPRFQGGKGRRAKSGGRRSVEGAARDSVLLRRALLLLLVSPRFGISSEGRRKGEAGEHRCGQKITRSFFVSSSGEARYNCGDCFFDSTMESMESLFDRRERIEGGKIPSDLPRSITARVLGSNRTRERGWTTTGAATNLTEL